MIEELEVPEELKWSLKRILKKIPGELKGDIALRKIMLIYLKLGGEKLAKQRIEITKKRFREHYPLINRHVAEKSIDDELYGEGDKTNLSS